MIGAVAQLSAVVIDWGGVLTQPITDTVRTWIAADQIDWERYVAVVGPWLADAYAADGTGGVNPVHALERGECTVTEFERLLAGLLIRTDGGPVLADGLLTRMLCAGQPVPAMYQLIRELRGKGGPGAGELRVRRRPRGERQGRGRLRNDRRAPHRPRPYPTAADGTVCQSLGFAAWRRSRTPCQSAPAVRRI
jgi:hypothetical protein